MNVIFRVSCALASFPRRALAEVCSIMGKKDQGALFPSSLSTGTLKYQSLYYSFCWHS